MFRPYILFMVNTGLRAREACFLKSSGVSKTLNKPNHLVMVVHVSQSHSKLKKRNVAAGRYTSLRALERQKENLGEICEG